MQVSYNLAGYIKLRKIVDQDFKRLFKEVL